jgi:hypothetical protein
MGPGTSWEPFTITASEYKALKKAVADTPISEIRDHARYAHIQLKFDNEFYSLKERFEWMSAICEKHRENWRAELKAGKPG